jgi:hypothetical protein
MPRKKTSFSPHYGAFALLVLALGFWLLPGQPVEAQCGSQASSCKNCHEVQAQLPVNTDGTGWHESHAFGDFCYICHAGNQQAMDKNEAHAGMVPPLQDVEASCQMCHAADLTERAQVYAAILNVELGGGTNDSGAAAPTSEPAAEDFWGGAPAATSAPVEAAAPTAVADEQAAVCPPADHELIVDDASLVDYARRYDEIVLGERPVNWGNVILGGLIGLLVIGGGGFVIVNEIRAHAALGETKRAEGEYPADVVDILPALAALKVQTRAALRRIISNPQKADKVLGLMDTVITDNETEERPQ